MLEPGFSNKNKLELQVPTKTLVAVLETLAMQGQQMYEIEVPSGVQPGQAFQCNVGGQLMLVTCPDGAVAGSLIQVSRMPSALHPRSASVLHTNGVPTSSLRR